MKQFQFKKTKFYWCRAQVKVMSSKADDLVVELLQKLI